MRKILFRSKSIEANKWIAGDYYRHYPKHIIVVDRRISGEADRIDHIEVHPETLCQFTGLTDKNGKEIYEGDIVKWDDCSNGKYWRFAVVEINPDIQFNCKKISEVDGIQNSTNHCFKYGNFIYKNTNKHLEIIGNIHDNPELLTK